MLERTRVLILMIVALCVVVATVSAQAPPCPGFSPGVNDTLACEIPTALRNSTSQQHQSLSSLSPTLAAQLSQLPSATAVSGSGLTFSRSLGVFTASNESLGSILTQRGETMGKHKFFVSLTYQRFNFDSVDGISLKHLNTVNEIDFSSQKVFVQSANRIDLSVDQFAAIGSFGLTSKLDLSVIIPFAKVTLKTGSVGSEFDVTGNQTVSHSLANTFLAGSANGPGDISVNLKGNVLNLEHMKIAVGGEVRFPTGDEANYLGTGAYGFKPYVVISRSGKFTPNINLGYQWNGTSSLFVNPTTGAQQNLPSSFLYSGGVDYRVLSRLTLTSEFLGQAVINGPRLLPTSQAIPGVATSFASVLPHSQTYTMDNLGVGFKLSPYKGWLVTANTLFALDQGGLRSKIIPLLGVSYKF